MANCAQRAHTHPPGKLPISNWKFDNGNNFNLLWDLCASLEALRVAEIEPLCVLCFYFLLIYVTFSTFQQSKLYDKSFNGIWCTQNSMIIHFMHGLTHILHYFLTPMGLQKHSIVESHQIVAGDGICFIIWLFLHQNIINLKVSIILAIYATPLSNFKTPLELRQPIIWLKIIRLSR